MATSKTEPGPKLSVKAFDEWLADATENAKPQCEIVYEAVEALTLEAFAAGGDPPTTRDIVKRSGVPQSQSGSRLTALVHDGRVIAIGNGKQRRWAARRLEP